MVSGVADLSFPANSTEALFSCSVKWKWVVQALFAFVIPNRSLTSLIIAVLGSTLHIVVVRAYLWARQAYRNCRIVRFAVWRQGHSLRAIVPFLPIRLQAFTNLLKGESSSNIQ